VNPIYPYRTLFGDIGLDVLAVSVDGSGLPYANISRAERTVALHRSGRERWSLAELRVRATLPAAELDDGAWADVVCVAVLSEKATNTRSSHVLDQLDDSTWEGTVELARNAHLSRATLTVNVVGTVSGVSGRLIGVPDTVWYVDMKAPAPVRQREVEVVEVDFRDGPHEWLRPWQDAPWIVDTSSDEIPTVFLNTTAVEGLIDVLHGSGGGSDEKLLRSMAAAQIAQDAWTAMFHTAISGLDLDEDGTPVMPGGWREAVLQTMLPDVLPGRQLTDALFDINERRTKGHDWSALQTGIQFAAGKRSQVARKLTQAVRAVKQAERTEER
jgi:hypothetical protein